MSSPAKKTILKLESLEYIFSQGFKANEKVSLQAKHESIDSSLIEAPILCLKDAEFF